MACILLISSTWVKWLGCLWHCWEEWLCGGGTCIVVIIYLIWRIGLGVERSWRWDLGTPSRILINLVVFFWQQKWIMVNMLITYVQYASCICSLYQILMHSQHLEYVCQQLYVIILRTQFIVQNYRCVALLKWVYQFVVCNINARYTVL